MPTGDTRWPLANPWGWWPETAGDAAGPCAPELWPALPIGTGPLGERLQRTLCSVGVMWHLWALPLGLDEGDSVWELGTGEWLQPFLDTS